MPEVRPREGFREVLEGLVETFVTATSSSQNHFRFLASSPWQNRVSGHLRAHRHVQPLEPPAYCPGSERNSTAFTTLKMAVLAPMPSASAKTATVVKAGAFLSRRKVYRRSCRKVDSRASRLFVD